MTSYWDFIPVFLLLLLPLSAAEESEEICLGEIAAGNLEECTRIKTTPQLVLSKGYPVEVHKVLTPDGYILEMQRIPGPNFKYQDFNYAGAPGAGRIVYIQHCVLCSSDDFISTEPHGSLAFLLADQGYDVWLGNYRGSFYSRDHAYLDPAENEFWKFSFMEMAHYDIPAMVDYILDFTGQTNLSYVGHSMGTTGLFAAMSLQPELNKKIRVMVAMAPVAYVNHVRGPFKLMFLTARFSYKLLEMLNLGEFLPRNALETLVANTLCFKNSTFVAFCQLFLPLVSGYNKGYINEKYLAQVLSHATAGTSVRTLAHFGQLITADSFQMFDFGPVENKYEYGEYDPPPFDLGKTLIPVGLFWGENDWVAAPEDVARTASELPNVVLNYRVPQDDFNHVDFLFSETAGALVYDVILQFLQDY